MIQFKWWFRQCEFSSTDP